MEIRLDHVVLWVHDPLRSVEFYERVVGLTGVRVEEFRAGQAPFPSVRVSGETIIDLMPTSMAARLNMIPGAEASAGNRVNHVCLAMSKADYEALRGRLAAADVAMPVIMKVSFGARGLAPEAFYFTDLDGNMLEARYYDES
jgi:catechol 2,3-dioxygenase-like lactoylglutathione lyase family enzyme